MDQQQQLQLATLAENRQLKDRVQKLSSLLGASSSTQKRQVTNKNGNLSNSINAIRDKAENDKQDQNHVVDEKQKRIHKNKTSKSWWHFW